MPIEREQFLKQFTQQALNERISLFLGAGGSVDVGYPNWANLFAPFAEELGTPVNESTDYYRLGQYYANKFGFAELRRRIHAQINRSDYESPLLQELIDVGFTNIWTTNFDNVIERNYEQRGILTNKVFRDSDCSNIDLHRLINIFKMNGDIANPEGIVATQNDYEQYSDTHRIMLMFFKRELIASTFLFIGYSFTDHLVLDCLSEIRHHLGSSATCHYTIIKKDNQNAFFPYFIEDLERRYQIRVLLVDDYSDILDVLIELNQRIRNKKVFISGAFTTDDTVIEEYSHALSKSLTAKLFENDYRIVNGIGRRFGTHIIGYANEHLAKKGVKNTERYLMVQPFVGNKKESPLEKRQLREKVIGQCGAAIFVFGDIDKNSVDGTSGVLEEFEIAKAQGKIIIPIRSPGMISEKIWNETKRNITEYPYLEKVIDSLDTTTNPDMLSQLIVYILNSIQDDK